MHTKRVHNVYKQSQSTSHSYKHDIIRHFMKEDKRRNTCNEIDSADVIIGAKSSFLNFEIIVLIFFMSLNKHFLFFLIKGMFYSEVAVVSHSLQLT